MYLLLVYFLYTRDFFVYRCCSLPSSARAGPIKFRVLVFSERARKEQPIPDTSERALTPNPFCSLIRNYWNMLSSNQYQFHGHVPFFRSINEDAAGQRALNSLLIPEVDSHRCSIFRRKSARES